MSLVAHSLRRIVSRGRTAPAVAASVGEPERVSAPAAVPAPIDIAPNDPIIPYFQSAAGAVDIEALELDSPALEAMRSAGVKLVVPLVTQGELIGLLNLGPRLSDQDYSGDDRRLLESLAAQAAPAVRVGQLVREQEAEIRSRERLEQELAVARLIQQNFLPRSLPEVAGWSVAADYRPAREVGGDFYDFIDLPDGRLGFVVGDVTDKGVPAALVMAATRSVLRASAQRLVEPGAVLERVNEHLVPDIPENMFVTCLYGVIELETGRLVFANAGHNLPMVASGGAVTELMARGMPLGLMPGMEYEETEALLDPGAHLLLYSDGVTEAHDADREMFGGGRLSSVMAEAGTRRRAGGRHHARRDPARVGRGRSRRAGRLLGRKRAGQRAGGDSPDRARARRGGAVRCEARADEDGRRRGGHERDGARQRIPAGAPGGRHARPRRRRASRRRHRPGLGATDARGAGPGHRRQARRRADAARVGALPDSKHGGRAGRVGGRRAPHHPARDAPGRRAR